MYSHVDGSYESLARALFEEMITGHDLNEGQYNPRHLNTDEIWQALSTLFTSRSKNSTSYKYGFLKAILDNLYNVDADLVLTFDQLFGKFAEIYWNLVIKYGVEQMPGSKVSAIETVLTEFVQRNHIVEGVPFESLTDEQKVRLSQRVKNKCKHNVVGALYGDTGCIFYSFSKQGEWIRFNPQVYEYVCRRKTALEKLNYYEWAKYLEKINSAETTLNLLTKLDESAKRSNLDVYRQILFDEFESKECFYCGRRLRDEGIQVDHFIPWAFIKDDKLWNMVLACPSCNNKKRDKLAATPYLDKLIVRNKEIRLHYYDDRLHQPKHGANIRGAEEMRNYKSTGLLNIYNYAQENGYDDIWLPTQIAR